MWQNKSTMVIIFCIGLLLLLTASAMTAQAATDSTSLDSELVAGDMAYNRSDFVAATEHFQKAVQIMAADHKVNGHLLYNLGNCYFRTGQYGLAMLAYEQAYALIPGQRDLQANIEMLREKLKLPDVDRGQSAWLPWNPWLSFRQLFYAWFIFHLLLPLIYFMRQRLQAGFWVSVAFYLLLSLSLAGKALELRQAQAIILADHVALKSGKGSDFITIAQLPQGSQVMIFEQGPIWWKVGVRSQNDDHALLKGYVPSQDLAELGTWRLVRGQNLLRDGFRPGGIPQL